MDLMWNEMQDKVQTTVNNKYNQWHTKSGKVRAVNPGAGNK